MARRKKKALFGKNAENGRAWKRFLLWLCAVAGTLTVLGIIGWYQMLAYLQSEHFRNTLSAKLGESTRAQSFALHSALHIDGDRVEEEGLEIRNAGSLRSARAGRISMEMERAALLRRRLHLRKISVEEAELQFEQNTAEAAKATGTSTSGKKKKKNAAKKKPAPASPAAEPSAPKTSSFFSLQGWEMELLECKDTELTLLRNGQTYSLQGCTLTTTPQKNGGWQHLAENGRLHTPFALLRGASVKTATLQQTPTALSLTDCRIMLSPGEMRVRAHQDLAADKWSANLALNKASIIPVLRGDWQKRVTGELFGKATLTGEHGNLTAGEGTLSLQQGVLEALPFLSELPSEGGYPYRHLELEKAECRLTFPYTAPELNIGEAWLADNINIRAKNGLLRVHGHVILGTDGTLSGTLTIGLPKALVAALPVRDTLQQLFNGQGEEGYLWVNVNLSGTLDDPQEDLSVRCASLVAGVLPPTAGQAAATAEQMLRLLLTPPSPAPTEGDGNNSKNTAPIKAAADSVQQGINGALKLLF